MLSDLSAALRWILSLGRRLFSVVPGFTLYSVTATLVSQLALLLASILPLKVILLLGSPGIPHYFPEQLRVFERQTLIIALSSMAVMMFLLHLLFEQLIGNFVTAGSSKLLLRSRKMVLFENQEEIAAKAYQRFSRGLASLVFLGVFVPVLAWLSPFLAVTFVLYIALAVASYLSFAAYSKGFEVHWASGGKGRAVSLLSGLGFLVCFAVLVGSFLWIGETSVLIAVLCLLLLRQLFKHVVNVVNALIALVDKRRQLSALFFHGHRLIDAPRHGIEGLWSLVEPASRDQWLAQALTEVTGRTLQIKASIWLQLGVVDVVAYRVSAAEGDEECCFMVKLFEHNRSVVATHEASLLIDQAGLPSLELVGVTDVRNQFHCHVFALGNAQQDLSKKWVVSCDLVRSALLACEPSSQLKALYRRSKPSLDQRVERDVLKRLRCILDTPAQFEALSCFEQSFDSIREMISGLPMVYVNPDIRRGLVMLDDEERAYLCHWGRWSLEPVGSGWPVDDRAMKLLPEAHASAVTQRSDMTQVKLAQLKLVALLFAFETRCKQQDYRGAVELFPGINASYAESLQ
ncbi:hypothetical protein SAMN05216296_2683 [Pseudomonas pohangensis]|uniref:Uncharacterized protein n=1 Tax=Pseudomonas pohangensis TaxID=364197 RepID=A0A1H2H140_9PSED|nr:hypothetical protein [Pseudomonas pohangensis]SDU25546.1 hypothetical protein SAMN05216296_2683 [Pseudomonas pohangensis]